MKTLSIVLSILVLVSVGCFADLSVGTDLYFEGINEILDSEHLSSNKKLFAPTIKYDKEIFDGLTMGFKVKTYLNTVSEPNFGIDSMKQTNWISYKSGNFTVTFKHYSHPRLQLYENVYSEKDKLVFEYSF